MKKSKFLAPLAVILFFASIIVGCGESVEPYQDIQEDNSDKSVSTYRLDPPDTGDVIG